MLPPGMVPVKIPAPGAEKKGSSCNTHTFPWGRPIVLPGHRPTAVRHKQNQIQSPQLGIQHPSSVVPNFQPQLCMFHTHTEQPQAALPLLMLCLFPGLYLATGARLGPHEKTLP